MPTRKKRKMRKGKKSRKAGGLLDFIKMKDKGCPEGTTRKFGAHCGFFRGPFGCCRKRLQFSDFKLGGTRKLKKKYL